MTQILMPMGGLGSRFTKQGYSVPKPLIEVDGKAMFMKALDSFESLQNPDHIFVLRKDQIDAYDLDQKIRQLLPDAKISVLEHNTAGAVETCLLAADHINNNDPIIIADCDIYFESVEYFKKVTTGNADGVLLTFNANHPRYSYVELDNSGNAIRTAEKKVISNHAILGGYYFKTGKLFKEVAAEFVNNRLPEGLAEYFVSHLFNMLIMRGNTVEIASVDTKHIFGTPEELTAYNNRAA